MDNLLNLVNYKVGPFLLIVFLTPAAQYLVLLGNPSTRFGFDSLIGNSFSWKFIGVFIVWALIWLKIPSKKFAGPAHDKGGVIFYQANGEIYYFATVTSFVLINCFNPSISTHIYENMGPILATLNLIALLICCHLMFQAKASHHANKSLQNNSSHPLIYQFYHGLELSPRILGVDVKQLTNCRVGMMLWQILILAFLFARWNHQLLGFSNAHFDNVFLQSFYIYMFFRWETGYFNTLDFTMDKTGWMLVWGCLVWIPSLYTFSSYFLVLNIPNLGLLVEGGMFILGLSAIWCHSEVDCQKESFKNANGKKIKIWGQPAKTLEINYTNSEGIEKKSQLLISGWWGIGRKMNYSFDIVSTLLWCLYAGFGNGVWPYACLIFVTILLIHRVFRDEERCRSKYEEGWKKYCSIVEYRMIPHIF